MQMLDAEATAAALPFPALVEAMRAVLLSDAVLPPRQVLQVPVPGGEPMTTLVMAAWWPGRCFGVKTIHIAPGNAARGLHGLHAGYQLFDANTGVPLAVIDGSVMTARRTAATAALAASQLARGDARRLLVVGSGRIAALLPEAYRAVRPIDEVRVWARSRGKAEALAAAWRARGIAASAEHDLEAGVRGADIVSCATLATAPLVRGAWLAPGSHLDLIGSFTPAMREADGACFAAARWWVDTEEALTKSGDLLEAFAEGAARPEALAGTLAGLLREPQTGRRGHGERTLFKSVGQALQDLGAAMLATGRL